MMVQEYDHHFRLRIRVLDIVLVIKWVANGKYRSKESDCHYSWCPRIEKVECGHPICLLLKLIQHFKGGRCLEMPTESIYGMWNKIKIQNIENQLDVVERDGREERIVLYSEDDISSWRNHWWLMSELYRRFSKRYILNCLVGASTSQMTNPAIFFVEYVMLLQDEQL